MGEKETSTQKLSEALDIVVAKMPKLMREIVETLYSQESATQIGKAVGTFYKELIDSGIKPAEAVEMSRVYLSTMKALTPKSFGDVQDGKTNNGS